MCVVLLTFYGAIGFAPQQVSGTISAIDVDYNSVVKTRKTLSLRFE